MAAVVGDCSDRGEGQEMSLPGLLLSKTLLRRTLAAEGLLAQRGFVRNLEGRLPRP